MKDLKTANDKIQEICDLLKKESLEPAQKEANQLLQQTAAQVLRIRQDAELEAVKIIQEARAQMIQEKAVYLSSLSQASKQALEKLRQTITEDFFNKELGQLIENEPSSSDLTSRLIESLISALDKEGLNSNLSVFVAKGLPVQDVAKKLSHQLMQKLSGQNLQVGTFKTGVELRVEKKCLTLDITENALKELLSAYLKKPEFRELIFQAV